MIHGWKVDADYLIGKRFAFVGIPNAVEFTCVSAKEVAGETHISAHSTDGACKFVLMSGIQKLLKEGMLVEADGPPFTNLR